MDGKKTASEQTAAPLFASLNSEMATSEQTTAPLFVPLNSEKTASRQTAAPLLAPLNTDQPKGAPSVRDSDNGGPIRHKTRCFDETTSDRPLRHFLVCGHSVTTLDGTGTSVCGGNCVPSKKHPVTDKDRGRLGKIPFACPCGHRLNSAFNYASARNAKKAMLESRGRRCKAFVATKNTSSATENTSSATTAAVDRRVNPNTGHPTWLTPPTHEPAATTTSISTGDGPSLPPLPAEFTGNKPNKRSREDGEDMELPAKRRAIGDANFSKGALINTEDSAEYNLFKAYHPEGTALAVSNGKAYAVPVNQEGMTRKFEESTIGAKAALPEAIDTGEDYKTYEKRGNYLADVGEQTEEDQCEVEAEEEGQEFVYPDHEADIA